MPAPIGSATQGITSRPKQNLTCGPTSHQWTRPSDAADQFPHPLETSPENQKHVTLLVHGYNNAWTDSMALYQRAVSGLYAGDTGLGECISFDWPSKGSLLGYLPDRSEARQSAQDFANVLGDLYDWLMKKQVDATSNPQNACKAQTSIVAHSMGSYVLGHELRVDAEK